MSVQDVDDDTLFPQFAPQARAGTDLVDEELGALPTSRVPHPGIPDPLLYVPGATPGTTRWLLRDLQLVNWGGFEGHVTIPVHPGATLLSGYSGTGKSTILDAYLALMMPSDVPFNGASNEVGGRARSGEQRNLLSYLRGQVDTVDDGDGNKRATVLRGQGHTTWGAVAATFVDDNGRLFTPARLFVVAASVTTSAKIPTRFVTVDGPLDLRELQNLVSDGFAPSALTAAVPGLVVHPGQQAFADRLFTRLGIGENGDGRSALALLARIQAGGQFPNVDSLYKKSVLEEPATFAAADNALAHFDDLEANYQEMLAESRKAEILAPITAKHEALTAELATAAQIDRFGVRLDAPTPFTVWADQTHDRLLEHAVSMNRAHAAALDAQHKQATAAVHDVERQLEEAKVRMDAAGGGALERIDQQLAARTGELTKRQDRLARLAAATRVLGDLQFADRAGHEQLVAAGAQFRAELNTLTGKLDDQRRKLAGERGVLMGKRHDLREDKASLQGRTGRVPRFLDEARKALAAASGIPEQDMPFVAELIDIRADQAQWRTAIETVLSSSARTMLLPIERLEEFSAAINTLPARARVTFEGVPTGLRAVADPDPTKIAGKLDYDEQSPYVGWVREHLSDPARNARCVTSTTQLAGHGLAVTLTGQTRQRNRGSHGRSTQGDIIGFSNESTLAQLDEQIGDINRELDLNDAAERRLIQQQGELGAKEKAYLALDAHPFEDLDVWSVEAEIATLHTERAAVLAGSHQLADAQKVVAGLSSELSSANQTVWKIEREQEQAATDWADLCDKQDEVRTRLDQATVVGTFELSEQDRAALDEHFRAVCHPEDPGNLERFEPNLSRLRDRLQRTSTTAAARVGEYREDLSRVFTEYLREFKDPNLSADPDAYEDFAAILVQITTVGLADVRQRWREKLTTWSGQDLVPLAMSMRTSAEEIRERLVPVNAILATLPFGATGDRLRISRRNQLALSDPTHPVRVFKRDLARLSGMATANLSDEAMLATFGELKAFMDRLRPGTTSAASDRNKLLDVRQHVVIGAERYDPADPDVVLATYHSLGGKSGGESQELIAFIIGAALRFRLGDELAERPRFAPVVLDEGFVKADGEFAGRSVNAWKELGFQLIVAAPIDKVPALSPHMDLLLAVTKDLHTHFSFISPLVRDSEQGQGTASVGHDRQGSA